MLTIERNGHIFQVVNDRATTEWNFWTDQYASGMWEPETLRHIARYEGGTYVDIGAWVGPTVLWASRFHDKVIAVEPDLVAFKSLQANVTENCDNVELINAAVTNQEGVTTLYSQGTLGNSMSTVLPIGDSTFDVRTIALENLLRDKEDISLVKIDIEGGEQNLLDDHGVQVLRGLNCPIIFGLHFPWVNDPATLWAQVNSIGEVEYLEQHPTFPTIFIKPKG